MYSRKEVVFSGKITFLSEHQKRKYSPSFVCLFVFPGLLLITSSLITGASVAHLLINRCPSLDLAGQLQGKLENIKPKEHGQSILSTVAQNLFEASWRIQAEVQVAQILPILQYHRALALKG